METKHLLWLHSAIAPPLKTSRHKSASARCEQPHYAQSLAFAFGFCQANKNISMNFKGLTNYRVQQLSIMKLRNDKQKTASHL